MNYLLLHIDYTLGQVITTPHPRGNTSVAPRPPPRPPAPPPPPPPPPPPARAGGGGGWYQLELIDA